MLLVISMLTVLTPMSTSPMQSMELGHGKSISMATVLPLDHMIFTGKQVRVFEEFRTVNN